MGVKVKDSCLVPFLRLELVVKCIGHVCCLGSAFVSERQTDHLGKRELSSRVRRVGKPYIGDTLHHAIICLHGGGESVIRKDRNFDSSIGPFFNFFTPVIDHLTLPVRSGEHCRIAESDRFFLRCATLTRDKTDKKSEDKKTGTNNGKLFHNRLLS